MTNVKQQILLGAGLRLSLRVVNIVVALFLTPYILLSLGDSAYGIWSLVGSFMAFYGLLDMSVSMAVNRYVTVAISEAEKSGGQDYVIAILSSGMALFLGIGLLVVLCTVGGMWPAALLVDGPSQMHQLRMVMLVMGLTLAISCPLRLYAGVLESKLRFDLLAIPQIVGALVRAGAIVVALRMGGGIVGIAIGSSLGVLPVGLAHLVFATWIAPGLRVRVRYVRWGAIRDMIRYGRTTLLMGIGDRMRTDFDSMIIVSFLNTAVLAHYRIAAFFAQNLNFLLGAIVGSLQPYFSRLVGQNNNARQNEVLLISTRLCIYIVTCVSVAMIVMGGPFITRWVGADYIDAYPSMVALIVGYLIGQSHMVAAPYLCARASHQYLAWRSLLDSGANVLLSIILVKPFGMFGVAIGTAIPLIISGLFVFPWMVHRVSGISYATYYGTVFKAYLISAVALAGPVCLAIYFARPNYPNLIGLGMTWFILYFGIICLWEGRRHLLRGRGSVGGEQVSTYGADVSGAELP